MKYNNITLGQVEAVWNKLGGEEGVRKFLSGEFTINTLGSTSASKKVIILSVDYNMSLEQMVASGNYDWKNGQLNMKNFPIIGEGIQWFEFELVHLNRNMSSEAAIVEMEKDSNPTNPWFAAKTEHLLTLGATFPELQLKHPIIALGSVAEVHGFRHVPYLLEYGSKRFLNLSWFDDGWHSVCRFLRVRKVSAPSAAAISPL